MGPEEGDEGPGVLEHELRLHGRERAAAAARLAQNRDVAPADTVLVEHHRHGPALARESLSVIRWKRMSSSFPWWQASAKPRRKSP